MRAPEKHFNLKLKFNEIASSSTPLTLTKFFHHSYNLATTLPGLRWQKNSTSALLSISLPIRSPKMLTITQSLTVCHATRGLRLTICTIWLLSPFEEVVNVNWNIFSSSNIEYQNNCNWVKPMYSYILHEYVFTGQTNMFIKPAPGPCRGIRELVTNHWVVRDLVCILSEFAIRTLRNPAYNT